jgi:anti-sigma-K factor RskA
VTAPVVPLDRSRRSGARRALPWVVGIAAAALVAVGLGVAATRTSEPTVVASAELDQLGDAGEGRAELLDEDGTYRLRVDTADLDAGDGFLEVWVIDEGVTRLVSLGPLRPDGTYDLPGSIDPREFPVVDVSVEPVDGDPTHSGDSVLRGTLEF